MAGIGLATAVGLGGKLESENSGVAEIIRQTGEGISGSIRQGGAGVNAGLQTIKAQEKEKELYTAPFSTNINALEQDKQQYAALANELTGEIKGAAEKGASASQLRDMKIKAADRLADAKQRYEGDLEAIVLASKLSEDPTVDISEFNRLVSQGGYNETEVYEEGNVGAGPVMEKSGAPFESGQEQVAGKDVAKRVGVPYNQMTLEQKKQVAPGGLMAELRKRTKDATGTFDKAAKSTFDQTDLGFMVDKRWEKINGVGQYVYDVNPERVAENLNTFLAQRGRTNDLETIKYWNTVTNKFEREGKNAGLAGQELKEWVDAGVEATGIRDFMTALEAARQKKMSNDKYTVDKEGKGMNIIISGGGSSVSDGKNVVNFVGQEVPNKDAISDANKEEIKKIQGLIADYESKLNSPGLSDANEKTYKKAINSLKNTANGLSKKRHKNYFDFSSVLNTDDPGMTFIKADNTEVVMLPQEIYKDESTGQLMIGGQIKTKIEEPLSGNLAGKMAVSTVLEDYSVPYNDGNKSKLFKDKPQLKPLFDKVDWTLLDKKQGAASKQEPKQGAKAPTKKDAVKILPSNTRLKKKDVESANFNTEQLQNNTPYFVDGVLYLWQDGQFKKVKR